MLKTSERGNYLLHVAEIKKDEFHRGLDYKLFVLSVFLHCQNYPVKCKKKSSNVFFFSVLVFCQQTGQSTLNSHTFNLGTLRMKA